VRGYGLRVIEQLVGKMRQAEVGRGRGPVPQHMLQVHKQRREQQDIDQDNNVAHRKARHDLRRTKAAGVGAQRLKLSATAGRMELSCARTRTTQSRVLTVALYESTFPLFLRGQR
jgi:hypothetical protein